MASSGISQYKACVLSLIAVLGGVLLGSCASTLPAERHDFYKFPESRAYVELPTGRDANRPYKPLGWVRTKVHYPTMEQEPNNPQLCRNYYNKGVGQLVKEARKVDADAVIQIRSVVLLMSGQAQEHATPECSDDGAEGEVLLKGIAIKFLPTPTPSPTP